MGRLPRTAPRLIAATILLLGCAPGPNSAPPSNGPVAAVPPAWATDPRIVADTTAPTADTLYAMGIFTQADSAAPVIVSYAAPPGADLREILDGAGAYRLDVLVTEDPNVIAYAAGRANYIVAALPWSTTYVLVPTRSASVAALPSVAERDALARNAVTVDARGAAEPFPWMTDLACASVGHDPDGVPLPVVAYATRDATARQLAERIVSLARANGEAPWLAASAGGRKAVTNLRIAELPAGGVAAAMVIPIARDVRTECATAGNAPVPAGAVPLVDTRAHVIVRRGSGAAFTIGAYGSLHFFKRAAP